MPLFLYIVILYSTYIHSITFIHRISSRILIAGQLNWKNLLGVPSLESNSGLPHSKPTTHTTELRRTLSYPLSHILSNTFRASKIHSNTFLDFNI